MSSAIFCFVDEIESTFVINDLIKVAGKYEKVYLFSIEKLDGKEHLPPNILVFEEFMNWENFRPYHTIVKNLFPILGIYFSECMALKRILPFQRAVALLASNIFKSGEVARNINESSLSSSVRTSAFYSFWFYDCIYLAWMKRKGMINYAVTRTHSGDLYEDHISISNKILFRNFQLRYLDAIFPVSNMGTQYLKNKYIQAKARIKTIFLGSADPLVLNPFSNQQYIIVSCASFRHHKRIHKIAEALLSIDIPLTWHHFGSENLDTGDPKIPEYIMRKEELIAKHNIHFIPHGYTSNDKLFEFYKNNAVNLFISLSEAEGIPVSMMEAISFGIPILSTDVGGCKEIVTEQTGVLIPLETEVREVAKLIAEFKDSSRNSIEFRKGVREFWEKKFNERINYLEFFSELEVRN